MEITIRVVPYDTRKPIGEATTSLLFEGEPQERRRAVVGNAASNLYPGAAGEVFKTRPQEGGR